MKPSYQGSLDGLCGMYAIVNCIHAAFVRLNENEKREILKTACCALSSKRWPKLVWEGTTFGDMRKMIAACLEIDFCTQISVSYPFQKQPPSTNKEYWHRLQEFMDAKNARAAIVGLEKPYPHWIGIGLDGKRVHILDGSAQTPLLRKNQSSIVIQEKNVKAGNWQLNPDEVAVFSPI